MAGVKCNKLATNKGKCAHHVTAKQLGDNATSAGKCYPSAKKKRIEGPVVGRNLNETAQLSSVPTAGAIPQTSHAPIPISAPAITASLNAAATSVAVLPNSARATIAASLSNREVFGGIDV